MSPVFELRLLVTFSREIIFVAPPVPTSPLSVSLPLIRLNSGKLVFYFDDWEVPGDNEEGGSIWGYDHFFVHFFPSDVPPEIESLFFSSEHEFMEALYRDPAPPNSAELANSVTCIPPNETPEQYARRKDAENSLRQIEEELLKTSEEMCNRLFSKPEIASYFGQVGSDIKIAVQNFLDVLRIEYHQSLIPDRPKIEWFSGHWILPESALATNQETNTQGTKRRIIRESNGYRLVPEERIRPVTQAFLNRLFPSSARLTALSLYQPIQPSDWSDVANHVENWDSSKPHLSEILLATALGECDPELGNPRLGLIEAVIALEIEVKTLMRATLGKYRLTKSAIDRIVRETPLADLVSVWIRREMPVAGNTAPNDDVYVRCAEAISERNELVHHERRSISSERALKHVRVIAELVEKARQVRAALANQD